MTGSEWKYVEVYGLTVFIEESIARDSQWVVFEPNDDRLWSEIRLRLEEFLHSLFKQGAFVGERPGDTYFVKCDRETMTQADMDTGVVNVLVAFAPLRPAEFVIIEIQPSGPAASRSLSDLGTAMQLPGLHKHGVVTCKRGVTYHWLLGRNSHF